MTPKPKLGGVLTAMITPFNSTGQIDSTAFESLVEQQVDAGVTGVVVCGTTGEAPTLSTNEKKHLVQLAAGVCSNKCEVMAGCGSSSTEATSSLAEQLLEAGAHSLLVVTPPYNKPSTAGLTEHFKSIRQRVGKTPICLYHVPGRTAQSLSAKQLQHVCEAAQVNSLKEASGDLTLFSDTVACLPDCSVLSGDDPTFLPSLAVGGTGVISVISHLFPKAMVKMQQEYLKGNHVCATKIHHTLSRCIELLFIEPNPAPLKFALATQTQCLENLRLPLVSPLEVNKEKIKQCVEQTSTALEELV